MSFVVWDGVCGWCDQGVSIFVRAGGVDDFFGVEK